MYKQLCFYTEKKQSNWKKKKQENDLWLYPKNKILKNKFNGDKRLTHWKLQNTAERK